MVYYETKVDNNIYRTFDPDSINELDLVWHRDKLDRHIHVITGKNWQFQFDDQLPVDLNKGDSFIIKANTYHRLIKKEECTPLIIKIIERG